MLQNIRQWNEKVTIRGPRLIAAFDAGILREYRIRGRNKAWFAQCEVPECTGVYNFTLVHSSGHKNKRCKAHARPFLVAGRRTSRKFLIKVADRVSWRKKHYGGVDVFMPYIRCEQDGCSQTSSYEANKTKYVCTQHCRRSNRLRPFESLYRAWCRDVTKRCQKRRERLPIRLSFKQFQVICTTQPDCHYCGETVNRASASVNYRKKGFGSSIFFDRVDASKTYSASNIVTCCALCNATKNNFLSYEEMTVLGALRRGDRTLAAKLAKQNAAAHLEWRRINALAYAEKAFGRKMKTATTRLFREYFAQQQKTIASASKK